MRVDHTWVTGQVVDSGPMLQAYGEWQLANHNRDGREVSQQLDTYLENGAQLDDFGTWLLHNHNVDERQHVRRVTQFRAHWAAQQTQRRENRRRARARDRAHRVVAEQTPQRRRRLNDIWAAMWSRDRDT